MDFCPNFCTDFCNEFLYGLLYESLYGFLSKFLYGFFVRISIQIFVRISVPIFIPICHPKLSHFCCFMPDAFKSVGTHWVQPLPHLPPPPPALPSPSAALPCIHGVPRLLPQLHGGVVEHRTAGGLREPPQRLPQPQIWRHLDRELPFPALFWGAFLLRCCGLRVRLGHRLFVINYVGAWWWFMWVCST